MTTRDFRLPDLGEGLTEGDILRWTVKVGDTVEVNDTIAEVETVKAAVELPSPFAGTVAALHAAEGETVPVGTPIISIDVPDGVVPGTAAVATHSDGEEPQLTLVGYGPREQVPGRRRRRAPATNAGAQVALNLPPAGAPSPAPPPDAVDAIPVQAVLAPDPEDRRPPSRPADGTAAAPTPARTLAKPLVRKLAKTLGVDLAAVTATGPGGTVSRTDVHSAADTATGTPADATSAADDARETRTPVTGVRKHTAVAMVGSAFGAPHVTEFVAVDVSAMMELRDRVAARREFRDIKVSPLVFVAKAVLGALARTPDLNARWDSGDDGSATIVHRHYVNLGIAAATPRGLIVPNIRDAQRLSLLELAQAMAALVATAREGRTTPNAMMRGTFTITNVGVFGVDTGTPILNPGEAGILAFGAVRRMPWVVGTGTDERIEPRWVTQLAVSFDHRVVDGEQGSRFLADVAAVLNDPGLALL